MSNLYHVPNRYTRGSIQLNKSSIGDIMELISLHPTAARVFFCICSYADIDNELIADIKTIKHIVGVKSVDITNALDFLVENAFIEIDRVEIKNKEEIKYKARNWDLYLHSKNMIWQHIDDNYVYSAKKEKTFMRITVNSGVAMCSNNTKINVLMLFGYNRLYDIRNHEEITYDETN